jgi:Neuraminidase (sialidase)
MLSIFPNPFISSTTIQTNYNLNNATLTIYNSYGQALNQIKNISGQTISLSRNNLPRGAYFLRLTEENKIIGVKKLIISN